MKKMLECDPVVAYIKNDPEIYSDLCDTSNQLEGIEYSNVRGHQDQTARELTFVEKMNNLATKAVAEAEMQNPEWNRNTGPMLKIRGILVMNKEGMNLSIAAERSEFKIWQVQKLEISKSTYNKIVWRSQHKAMAAWKMNANRFAVRFTYHWLPSGRQMKMNNPHNNVRCPLCSVHDETSSHFLRCQHCTMDKSFVDMIVNIHDAMQAKSASMPVTRRILENLNR